MRLRRRVAHVSLCLALAFGIVPLAATPAYAQICDSDGFCYPDPAPPPAMPSCSSCIPVGHVPVPMSGTVTTKVGTPIEGATVYWTYGKATTNASGAFTLSVWADSSVRVYISAPLYRWFSVYFATGIDAARTPWAWEMASYIYTQVRPGAFNNAPQKTILFDVITTAPVATNSVLVQVPSGALVSLAYKDAVGIWAHWTGNWVVPVGTADGVYTYQACVVQTVGSVGCSVENSDLISDVAGYTYVVDSVSPVISPTAPVPEHNTVSRRPAISAAVTDALSGVASRTFSLDGTSRSATVSGSTYSFTPTADLSLGIHTVQISATDLAGNSATRSWRFNVVTLTATSALAHMTSQTVNVNPNNAVPPPSTVTFNNVQMTLDAYSATLSSSLHVGQGTLNRAMTGAAASVTFVNSAGLQQVVTTSLPTVQFAARVATAFAESDPVTVSPRVGSAVIPALTVSVPVGFNGPDSTATVAMVATQVGGVTAAGGDDPNPTPIPNGRNVILVSVGTTVVVNDSSTESITVTPSTNASIDAQITLPDGSHPELFVQILDTSLATKHAGDASAVFYTVPTSSCGGDPEDGSCFYQTQPIGQPPSRWVSTSSVWLNLGSEQIGLYSNHWLFRSAHASTYLDWQQSSGIVPSTISCPESGYVIPGLQRFTNEGKQLPSGLNPWRVQDPVRVSDQGTFTGANDLWTSDVDIQWDGAPNAVSNSGWHSSLARFGAEPNPIAPDSDWARATLSIGDDGQGFSNANEQMISAIRFHAPDGPKTMSLFDSNDWTIIYDNHGCS